MVNGKTRFLSIIYNNLKYLANRITYSQDLFNDEVWKIRLSKRTQRHIKYSTEKRAPFFAIKSRDDVYKYMLVVFMTVMLFVVLHLSRNVGISTREVEQNRYTALVYNHFHHTGDTEAYKEHPYAKTQAQFIDLIIYSIGKTLHISDIFIVKHFVSAIFGWLLILYLSILVLKAFNWRAAFFAAFFLFISPRFIGYSVGNVVDVTFAFGFVFTITQIYYFCRELPVIRIYRLVKIIAGTLIAVSTYNAGFVLIRFFFLFTILNYFFYSPLKKFYKFEYLKPLFKLIGMIGAVTALVYLVHAVATTFLIHSVVSPGNAFALLTLNYPIADNQLFAGDIIGPDNFPKRYIYQYLFITTPTIVSISALLFFIFFKNAIRSLKPFSLFIFLYTFFYCIHQVKSSYMNPDTMWAIYFFLYPMFMLIAVSGLECALRSINDRYANFVVICIVALLSFMPIRHIAFNHPVFIYFNGIAGGIHNGYASYELDCDQTNKSACNWMKKYLYQREIGRHADRAPLIVATNGNSACSLFFAADSNIVLRYQEFNPADTTWDYYIAFCKEIPSTQLRNGTWPADTTMHRMRLEHKTLVAFYQNRHRAHARAVQDSLAQAVRDSLAEIQNQALADGIETSR